MITSHGRDGQQVPRGLQQHLRSFSGAVAARVIEPADMRIEEHHHDWPVLTLYVMGDVIRVHDGGELRMNRPSVALHRAGQAHANVVRSAGLEQVDIEFDPSWLRPISRSRGWSTGGMWMGGALAAKANLLRRQWADGVTAETELAKLTGELLEAAFHSASVKEPQWLTTVLREVEEGNVGSTAQLARRLGLHPGWLAQAYRAAVGEGLGQTVQRHRIQRAVMLLRTTDLKAVEVAADTGFCDQSHMIRSVKRLLGRSPSCIRAEGDWLKVGRCLPT